MEGVAAEIHQLLLHVLQTDWTLFDLVFDHLNGSDTFLKSDNNQLKSKLIKQCILIYSMHPQPTTGSHLMIEHPQDNEAEHLKRQEHRILEHHNLKDIRIRYAVLPVTQSL